MDERQRSLAFASRAIRFVIAGASRVAYIRIVRTVMLVLALMTLLLASVASSPARADGPAWSAPAQIAGSQALPSEDPNANVGYPVIASGPDGTTAVAWFETTGAKTAPGSAYYNYTTHLRLARFSPSGPLTSATTVASWSSPGNTAALPLALEVGADGALVMAFNRVLAAEPTVTKLAIVRVSAAGQTSPVQPVSAGVLNAGYGQHAGASALSLASDGTANVAWATEWTASPSSYICHDPAADPGATSQSLPVYLSRVSGAGAVTTREVASGPCISNAVTRILSDGQTLVGWTTDPSAGARQEHIQARKVTAGGSVDADLVPEAAQLDGLPALGGDGSITGLHLHSGAALTLTRMNASGTIAPRVDMGGSSTPDWMLADNGATGHSCAIFTAGGYFNAGGPERRKLWMTNQ